MDRISYDSLSPRELDCLRLVGEGLETKQIAVRLTAIDDAGRTLTPDTVDKYIKSAMRKLGCSRRKDAARLVAEHEGTLPQWLGVPAGGDTVPPAIPAPVPPVPSAGREWFRLPLRRRGEVNNDLGIGLRLLWIPILAVALATGFGMLTTGAKVLQELIGSARLLNH